MVELFVAVLIVGAVGAVGGVAAGVVHQAFIVKEVTAARDEVARVKAEYAALKAKL